MARLEASLIALERSVAAFGNTEALSGEERRRLTQNLEGLLEEVRQLADFLDSDDSEATTR